MLDYLAGIFELLGLYVIGNKSKYGFLFNCIGNILWIIVALTCKVYGLLIVVVPAFFINIRNYKAWKN